VDPLGWLFIETEPFPSDEIAFERHRLLLVLGREHQADRIGSARSQPRSSGRHGFLVARSGLGFGTVLVHRTASH
jgi:hypothetical protein